MRTADIQKGATVSWRLLPESELGWFSSSLSSTITNSSRRLNAHEDAGLRSWEEKRQTKGSARARFRFGLVCGKTSLRHFFNAETYSKLFRFKKRATSWQQLVSEWQQSTMDWQVLSDFRVLDSSRSLEQQFSYEWRSDFRWNNTLQSHFCWKIQRSLSSRNLSTVSKNGAMDVRDD